MSDAIKKEAISLTVKNKAKQIAKVPEKMPPKMPPLAVPNKEHCKKCELSCEKSWKSMKKRAMRFILQLEFGMTESSIQRTRGKFWLWEFPLA